jgi:hypothetical protein
LLNGCWLYCIAFAIFLGLCFWAFHSDHWYVLYFFSPQSQSLLLLL